MKKNLVERMPDFVLAFALLWFLTSFQSPLAKAPNQPGPSATTGPVSPLLYLNYYNTFRNAGLVRVNTLSNYRIAQQTARLDQKLFRMDSDLLRRDAISEEDFYQSELRRNLSRAREKQLAQRAVILDATRDLNLIQSEIIRGDAIELSKLYEAYTKQWKGECALFKENIALANAQLAWDRYILEKDSRLVSKGDVSHAEHLEHQRNVYAAEDDLATQRFLDKICLERIPTYEEVKKISPSP